jgi:hypothetical protein
MPLLRVIHEFPLERSENRAACQTLVRHCGLDPQSPTYRIKNMSCSGRFGGLKPQKYPEKPR